MVCALVVCAAQSIRSNTHAPSFPLLSHARLHAQVDQLSELWAAAKAEQAAGCVAGEVGTVSNGVHTSPARPVAQVGACCEGGVAGSVQRSDVCVCVCHVCVCVCAVSSLSRGAVDQSSCIYVSIEGCCRSEQLHLCLCLAGCNYLRV